MKKLFAVITLSITFFFINLLIIILCVRTADILAVKPLFLKYLTSLTPIIVIPLFIIMILSLIEEHFKLSIALIGCFISSGFYLIWGLIDFFSRNSFMPGLILYVFFPISLSSSLILWIGSFVYRHKGYLPLAITNTVLLLFTISAYFISRLT